MSRAFAAGPRHYLFLTALAYQCIPAPTETPN